MSENKNQKIKCIACKKQVDISDEADDEYFSLKISTSKYSKQAYFCLDCADRIESRKEMLSIIKNNPEQVYIL